MNNYYQILGVDKSATQEEIKKAYRRLAAQHHPDRGGDTEKFQEIQAAYDVLGDQEKRQQYDNPQPQFDHYRSHGGMPPGFEDMINQMFGNQGFGDFFQRRTHPQRNRTLQLQTTITLEDSFFGKNITTNIQLPSGRNQTIEIKIPAGIRHGTTLRLASMGDDSVPNLPRGDIHLTVVVSNHPVFVRDNDDLRTTINITCFDAVLGKKIKITSIDGKLLETEIPAGIQPGQMLNLPGYGMPNISNSNMRGRLLIDFNITIPTTLTEHQKSELRKIIS